MNEITTDPQISEMPELAPEDMPPPDEELIADDGVPMETYWHRCAMNLLIESASWYNRERTDFFVGGNMFIYYSSRQARTREYRGPDFFFVWGVPHFPMRPFWAVWNEGGKYPDLIIELLSPSTAQIDLTVKKELYRTVFHTNDYFCYDPATQSLRGWRLRDGEYEPLTPNAEGRLWCQELGLWLGVWKGTYLDYENVWLRFFDSQGRLVPIGIEEARANLEAERRQAEQLKAMVGAEQKRAEAAEAEAERLRALLLAKDSNPQSNGGEGGQQAS